MTDERKDCCIADERGVYVEGASNFRCELDQLARTIATKASSLPATIVNESMQLASLFVKSTKLFCKLNPVPSA